MNRPEAVTHNLLQVLAAFSMGLVTVFGGALVYSSLQHRGEVTPVVQSARAEHPALPAEDFPSATVPAYSLPDILIPAESAKQTTQSSIVLVPSPKRLSPAQIHSADRHSQHKPQPVPPRAAAQSLTAVTPAHSSSEAAPASSNIQAQSPSNTSVASSPSPSIPEPPQSNPAPVSSAPASQIVVIPATTILQARLSETLSSDRNQPGDIFQATLVSPLIVNGYVLAETGATLRGQVGISRRASLIRGQAQLSVALTEIETADGRQSRVQTGWREIKGVHDPLTSTGKLPTGAVNGVAREADTTSSAFEKGRSGSKLMARKVAVFPAGAQLTFILTAPLTATGMRLR